MIYIHVPFCRSFCVYCDFYSEIACRGKDRKAIEAYADCICREAESRRKEIAGTLGVNTLYIGGGTPSVLPLDVLGRIVGTVKACCKGAAGEWEFDEFTIEVNPEDIVERGETYVRGLLELGVNRVSMGVQSLDDEILKWMGRRHDAAQAIEAVRILKAAGVNNLSIDLISGISQLGLGVLDESVSRVLELGVQHISSYQLSIEEGSALDAMTRDGRYTEASDDLCRTQYDLLCKRLGEAGFEHYEISNWALPGYRSLHNSSYWTRAPYVGLGPGAHSLKIEERAVSGRTAGGEALSGLQRRSWNSEALCDWTADGETLSEEEIREERIMLALRTAEGLEGHRIPESDWFIADSIIAEMI